MDPDLVLTVLAGVGTPLLAANCLRALQKMLPMTFCTVYVVGPDGRIQTVSAASAYGTSAERTAALYVDRRYDRCDPHMLWLAGRKLPVQAQLWLGHHQGDELMDAEYRAACYDSVGIRERASVLQLSPSGERTAVSFYRSFAQPEFDRDDFAVMGQHAAFLAEAVSAHRRSRTPRTESGSSSLDSRMLSLSLREREVIGQLLQGRTAKEAARLLGIMPTTLRTLQYRAFRRLGIRTTGELLLSAAGTTDVRPLRLR
ncbi:MAG: LuxR C-terminal-related transcriptional regulator [Candidatus Melainabacteria bacterium]